MAGYKQIKEQWRRQDKKAEALDPATPAMLKRADKLGRQGYFAGKKAPAQDAEILDMCKNRPHNTSMKLMTAWGKGWQDEHIKSTDAELRAKGFYDKPRNSKPKKTAAAKPKAKKTAATPKLTASQREYLAINGFVMVKRGGKYVRITG